jgi:MFS family permease
VSARRTPPWPLVALFTAGYLASYLLPTTVGRLDSGLPLTATQAGAIGSALLLSSATAGFLLASRVDRIGPRALARAGLALAFLGYGGAALTTAVPAVVAGTVVGGFGSGTVTVVAASGIAAHRDPHRVTTLGLLGVSALAGALYLAIPRLGPAHGLPLAAMALTALAVWPFTGPLSARTAPARASLARSRLPHLRAGLLLAAAMPCWSLAQNALWGVSGRIGLAQAHLTEVTVGAVFAVALGAGLLGVLGAGALGPRLGRAVPIGAGTALIAACIALSASASDLPAFAAGEISWNLLYPVVLSYVIGLAASLDPRGRWAVFVGAAGSLGTAAGPLTGSVLAGSAGFTVMGEVLAAGLLLVAVPLTVVALRTGRRPLPVVELPVETPAVPAQGAYDTASPNSYASTSAR